MEVSFKARVIMDKSVKSYNPEIRTFIEEEAKPTLENKFKRENVILHLSMFKEDHRKLKLGHHDILPLRFFKTKGHIPELIIKAYENTFLGKFKKFFNPAKAITKFDKVDKILKRISKKHTDLHFTDVGLKAVLAPDRYSCNIKEVLKAAKKAINKLKH